MFIQPLFPPVTGPGNNILQKKDHHVSDDIDKVRDRSAIQIEKAATVITQPAKSSKGSKFNPLNWSVFGRNKANEPVAKPLADIPAERAIEPPKVAVDRESIDERRDLRDDEKGVKARKEDESQPQPRDEAESEPQLQKKALPLPVVEAEVVQAPAAEVAPPLTPKQAQLEVTVKKTDQTRFQRFRSAVAGAGENAGWAVLKGIGKAGEGIVGGIQLGVGIATEGAVLGAKGIGKATEGAILGAKGIGKFGEGMAGGVGLGLGLATAGITKGRTLATDLAGGYIEAYNKTVNADEIVDAAKSKMRGSIKDEQFVQLYDFASQVLADKVVGEMNRLPADDMIRKLNFTPDLMKKLVRINLAKAFVNLAQQLYLNKAVIPNYDNQTALVNLVALVSQKLGAHIPMEALHPDGDKEALEAYQDGDKEVLIEELAPLFIKDEVKKQKLLQDLSAQINDRRAFSKTVKKLVPNFDKLDKGQLPRLLQLFEAIGKESLRNEQLQQLFNTSSENFLTLLFPNKAEDFEFPGVGLVQFAAFFGPVQRYAFDWVKTLVSKAFADSYSPMRNDPLRTRKWEQDIQSRIGQKSVEPLVRAPSVLLLELTKSYVKSDPSLVTKVSGMLRSALVVEEAPAVAAVPGAATPDKAQKDMLAKMADDQLASWMVASAQSLLQTEDPNLLRAGSFLQNVFQNLTLGLLAKTAEQVIPEGEEIPEDQFLKEVSDRLVAQLKKLADAQDIPEADWNNFIKDLPLPPLVKGILISQLTTASKNLQQTLTPLKQKKTAYEADLAQIKASPQGKQLLSIIDKIVDKVVDMGLEHNQDLISKFDLGNSLEKLIEEHLPGIKIDQNLIDWFKSNVSSFGQDPSAIDSISILKEGVRAVLTQAIANTVKANFNQDGATKFADQLVQNLKDVFLRVFPDFGNADKKNIKDALEIQREIQTSTSAKEEIQKEIDAAKLNLAGLDVDEEVISGIKAIIHNRKQLRSATLREKDLREKFDQEIEALNTRGGPVWNAEHLENVRVHLAWQKENQHHIDEMRAKHPQNSDADLWGKLRNQLEIQRVEYARKSASTKKTEAKKAALTLGLLQTEIENCESVIGLLQMPVEKLTRVKNALFLSEALPLAEREKAQLASELDKRNIALVGRPVKAGQEDGVRDALKILKDLIENQDKLTGIKEEIETLDKKLDAHVVAFTSLADEGLELAGIQPLLSQLPFPLPIKKFVARLLLEQFSPILMTYYDRKLHRKELRKATGSDFLSNVCKSVANETIAKLPSFISYYPVAKDIFEVLKLTGKPATDEEIENLNKQILIKISTVGNAALKPEAIRTLLANRVPEENLNHIATVICQKANKGQLDLGDLKGLLGEDAEELTLKEILRDVQSFAFNLGRDKLTDQDLREAHSKSAVSARRKSWAAPKHHNRALALLKQHGLLAKVKTVMTSPEEIASLLNAAIPGAEDMQTLLAPQVQAILNGKSEILGANREIIQNMIESILLKSVARIVKNNGGGDFMANITAKLKEALNPHLHADASEDAIREAAKGAINKIIAEVVGINSKEDLEGIPPVLQQMIFDKLHEQLHTHLTPLIMPIIDRQIDRLVLDQISKSKFLSHICAATAQFVVAQVPVVVQSPQVIAQKIYSKLTEGQKPNLEKQERFMGEIDKMVRGARGKLDDPGFKPTRIKTKTLLQAYERSTLRKKPFSDKDQATLIEKLRSIHAKEEMNAIAMSPDQIADMATEALPHAHEDLQKGLASRLQSFIHSNGAAYHNLTDVTQQFIEDILLKAFIKIAEKNPPHAGKTVPVVLVEKLVDILKKNGKALTEKSLEEVVPEFADQLVREVLGIESPEDFEGLPKPVQVAAYQFIKGQMISKALELGKYLQKFNNGSVSIEQARKDLGKAVGESVVELVFADAGRLTLESLLHEFNIQSGGKPKAVTMVTENVRDQIEALVKSNFEIAKVLTEHSEEVQGLKDVLGGVLHDAENMDKDYATLASNFLGNVMLKFSSKPIKALVDFEQQHKAKVSRELMTSVFKVFNEHLDISKVAKDIATARGAGHFNGDDYKLAAGRRLHEAVPVDKIDFIETVTQIQIDINITPLTEGLSGQVKALVIDLIKNDRDLSQPLRPSVVLEKFNEILPLAINLEQATNLMNIMKREADAHKNHRMEHFYKAETDKIFKLIFPNGALDLDLPEKYKKQGKQVMDLIQNKLGSVMLPMIMETIFDPHMVTKIIANSLGQTKSVMIEMLEGLDKGIEEPAGEPESPEMDELDKVSGELILRVLDFTKLPPRLVNLIKDPKTGEISPDMGKTMGRALRKQFNEDFIQKMLKIGFEKAAERDALTGKPTIAFDARDEAIKGQEKITDRVKMDNEIETTTRELVDLNVAFILKSQWKDIQKKWGNWLEAKLGKIGKGLRKILDKAMNMIFSMIVWAIFENSSHHLRPYIRTRLYRYLEIDENRKRLVDMFREAPEANEDFTYKVIGAMGGAFERVAANTAAPAA